MIYDQATQINYIFYIKLGAKWWFWTTCSIGTIAFSARLQFQAQSSFRLACTYGSLKR